MYILVNRFTSDSDTTLSLISINGSFECFGCEDEKRETKIAGETRIPSGIYKVGLRTKGGLHARYSKKFPASHAGMLQILDVPGFEYILIHIGNDDDDTAGCLLLGAVASTVGRLTTPSSTSAYKAFYAKVIQAAKEGSLWIRFQDNDV